MPFHWFLMKENTCIFHNLLRLMLFIVLKVAVGEYSNLLISLEVSLFLDFFSQRFLIFSSFEKNPVNKHSKTKL